MNDSKRNSKDYEVPVMGNITPLKKEIKELKEMIKYLKDDVSYWKNFGEKFVGPGYWNEE